MRTCLVIVSIVFGVASAADAQPKVGITPRVIQEGQVVTATGSGFTPSGNVLSHLVRPDGSEYPEMQLAADARGGISHLLRIILIQTGTYELQTIDLASKAVAVSRFMVVEGALPAGLARALEPGASTTSRWPSSLVGTWQGRVAPNGAALRPVLITLTGGETGAVVGTIAYPSLECGGELWLMNAPGDPVLGEHITYGQERCSGAGLVTVRLGKDGALEIQRTEAGHPAAPSAIGTLPKRM